MKINRETVTGKSNTTVKWVASLFDKRGREESESFVVEGVKLTREAAEAGLDVTHLIVKDSRFDQMLSELSAAFSSDKYELTQVVRVADHLFDRISSEKAPQGVIAIIKYLDFFRKMDIIYKEDFFLSDAERCIVLCSLRDPSNLGAIIRSAAALGVDRLILTSDCADIYSAKTVRASMGTLFSQRIDRTEDLCAYIACLKQDGRRVFAAALDAQACCLGCFARSAGDCAVIGNEGHGLSQKVIDACGNKVYIPMTPHAESLNAAVAAAILMWELGRSDN